MSKFQRDIFLKYASELCAELEIQDQKIEDLNKQCGTFQAYERLATFNRSYDFALDSEWKRFENDYESDKPLADKNTEADLHNKQLLDKLVALIAGTGIGTTVQEWKRNKYVPREADWKSFLRTAMPRDGRNRAMLDNLYAEKKSLREKKVTELAAAEKAAKDKADRDAANAKRVKDEAIAVVRCAELLGVDPAGETCRSLCDQMRERDKYFDLALGGMQTRGSWLDGPWAAEDALGRFSRHELTGSDSAIIEDWQELLSDFDDGRCFRDTKYSYDVVMSMASETTLAAYKLICDFYCGYDI